MFTGLIEATGRVRSLQHRAGDVRIWIESDALDLADVRLGDSIAINGVCLTAVELGLCAFAVDVSNETLSCTTLGGWAVATPVNLEKALRLGDRLGGHLVSGHVDAVGKVLDVQADGRSQRWRFALPAALERYVAAKGSIAIDGVSLTVNDVDSASFGVNLIPHTLEHTVFASTRIGDQVNLEIDLMARYAERLMLPQRE